MRIRMPIYRHITTLAVPAVVLAGCGVRASTPQVPDPTAASPTDPARATETREMPTESPPTAEIPCFGWEDLQAMDLAHIAELPVVCFEASSGTTVVDQTEAIEVVRAFIQDPARLVAFREMTTMANSPSGSLPVARFEDDAGAYYLLAIVAGKVLEMGMDPGPLPPGATNLSNEKLQSIAEALIRREIPAFDEMRDGLTFLPGEKSGGVNFFRWEHASGPGPSGMPPLAQVGITDDGRIFSYLNTLYVLQ